ncbi:MAG: M20/M25/M40 family metallo-hydrolase, partial [Acidobacteriota bacterium]|nr:M20/M25/M40 family metallo-hydrolase [Acidobacteriota bacterium]
MPRKIRFGALTLSMGLALLVFAQQPEHVDLNVIHKIKVAEFGAGGGGRGGGSASKVMDTMWNLTDRYGPRLTNSPNFRAAGNWAVGQLKEWNLSNVQLEKWSTVGVTSGAIPGWQVTSYSGAMVEPSYMPLVGMPVAWTEGTKGPMTAEVVIAPIEAPADQEKYKGKVKGKIVLTSPMPELAFPTAPLASRYTPEELSELSTELIPGGRGGRGGAGRGGANAALLAMTPEERLAFQEKQRSFWKNEGALMTIQATARGESGTYFGGGASRLGDVAHNLPQVTLTAENYNRIYRLVQHNVPVKLSFDIKTEFTPDTESFNVVAEIPGIAKPQETVLVGGHFDSWHYGTGATDNAAGSAVAMEVMRILKSLNLKMDRTVRLVLWGGEEEGLLGSAAYV